ncbi:MAG: DUF1353 domain-containing protein [Methylococcales bacterium]|nr:DUF1353 domain-containing protein [Methylococcales bacterium]
MNTKIVKPRPIFDISLAILTVVGLVIWLSLYFFSAESIPWALLVGAVVYLGVGLPRWQGMKIRRELAETAKQEERGKWGFNSRDREGPWLNFVDLPVLKQTPIAANKRFYSERLIIHNGLIIVNPGPSRIIDGMVEYDFSVRRAYAWDGCTPKRWFFWLALIGTPDWDQKSEVIRILDASQPCLQKTVFWQRAHHASLVHDALYQYINTIPIAKKEVDQLFYDMLLASGFSVAIATLYRLAVRYFGAREVKENDPKANSQLQLVANCASLLAITAACQLPD